MKKHNAFTMIELIFVIIIIGIIGKFGLEFLAQAYKNFMFSSINSTLQANSAYGVEFISTRLQHRIKSSAVSREPGSAAVALQIGGDANSTVLEWINTDSDGFRGNSSTTPNLPNWSGVIDVDLGVGADLLTSPETNTTAATDLINVLSNGDSSINTSALFFVGSTNNSDINNYGFNGISGLTNQTYAMLPINSVTTDITQFKPATGTLSGVNIYEYYLLSWTAYAVVHNPSTGDLTLHYDYQPWLGDTYLLKRDGITPTKTSLIMTNVTTFRFLALSNLIKIQVCVGTSLVEEYSLCKEKTVF